MIIIRVLKICDLVIHEPLCIFFPFFASCFFPKLKSFSRYIFDEKVVKDTLEHAILYEIYLQNYKGRAHLFKNIATKQ